MFSRAIYRYEDTFYFYPFGSDVYMQKQNPLLFTFYLFLETEEKNRLLITFNSKLKKSYFFLSISKFFRIFAPDLGA